MTVNRLVGTGDSQAEALNDLVSKLPKGKKFSKVYVSNAAISYESTEGKKASFVPTNKTTGSTYKSVLNVVQSDNGIFFYQDNGTAVACLITMSDDTEYMVDSDGNYTTYNGGTLNKVYVPASGSGYVVMCPVVYQSTSIGKIGADSGDVLFVEGIANNVWSPNGVKINGHTYYGCGKFCTRAS